jgi:NADPH:quinone reductase
MRAIVLHEAGGPDALKLEEVPEPVAGPGEIVIRTEAIGVSFTEAAMRKGGVPFPVPLPAVYGFEAAGIVTDTGEGVSKELTGRRVTVLNPALGCYAEYVKSDAASATEIPEGLDAADAIAVANFGAVALCVLQAARLTGTETVLVEVAAGGVGGYLTQLAHAHGARRVIGTAGSQVKRDYARSLGADEVLDHTDPAWPAKLPEAGIDAVFESLAGDTTVKLIPALTPLTGRILLYGLLQGPPTLTPMDLLVSGLTLVGCGGMPAWLNRVQAARPQAMRLAVEGTLKPQIDSVLPLADVARAHEKLDNREALGKIILRP